MSIARAEPVAANPGRVLDFVELTKPRITFLVLVTTAVGYSVGATGRFDPVAFAALLVVSGAGLAVLGSLNLLTIGLGAGALASYVLVYTPLKRVTSLCTVVGAVPGAIPPMMGW